MNCCKPAIALLTFAPQQAKAWLYDLDQPDPTGGIMLCRKHANGTVVPMSWQLIDARDPAWPGPARLRSVIDQVADLETAQARAVADDAAIDEAFAALHADLPIPVVRESDLAAGRTRSVDRVADPSLFELPIADIPAVTPYSRT